MYSNEICAWVFLHLYHILQKWIKYKAQRPWGDAKEAHAAIGSVSGLLTVPNLATVNDQISTTQISNLCSILTSLIRLLGWMLFPKPDICWKYTSIVSSEFRGLSGSYLRLLFHFHGYHYERHHHRISSVYGYGHVTRVAFITRPSFQLPSAAALTLTACWH